MRATWNGVVLAESEGTIVVEGNHYFPPDSVKREHMKLSDTHTNCPRKGEATYYHIEAGGQVNRDAAWTYPDPKPAAAALGLKDHVAFWRGVKVEA